MDNTQIRRSSRLRGEKAEEIISSPKKQKKKIKEKLIHNCYSDTNKAKKAAIALKVVETGREFNKSSPSEICEKFDLFLSGISCLKSWKMTKLLGAGTIGTVFGVCEHGSSGKCGAIKIQNISSGTQEDSFLNEIEVQKELGENAPHIFGDCVFFYKSVKYAAIVMEQLDTTFDEWLSNKRTIDELDNMNKQLEYLFEYLRDHKITHGDTALFNIGIVSRHQNPEKLIFLDFDRGSTNIYSPKVDALRIFTEFIERYRSEGTAHIEKTNEKYFFNKTKKMIKNVYGPNLIKSFGQKTSSEDWFEEYEKYCVEAKVLCL
jgi:hypothetical protein